MRRIIALILILSLCAFAPNALAAEAARARTSLAGVSRAGRSNIELAASSISGLTLAYGETFSFNDLVGPRSERYGYEIAANGRGVQTTGGGVAQVAAAIYLALEDMRADVEYLDLNFYGDRFAQSYVSDGDDAVMVDYEAGHDFSFVNYEGDLALELWLTDSYLYCAITQEDDFGFPEGELLFSFGSASRRPVSDCVIWIDGTDALRSNILHAASSINDTVLPEGAVFSFNDVVGPRSEECGYQIAVNGRGVEVVGGGVAQVASALFLAVKNLDGVAVLEKSTYGSRYNQSYVSSSNDAILTDYKGGTDFSFRNTGEGPLRICTYVSGDALYCEIYRLS